MSAGLGASAGGSNGVNAGLGASVGGNSGVNAGLGASVGGANGVDTGLGAVVGVRRGVKAGLGATIGGNNGVDVGLGAGIGNGIGVGLGVDIGDKTNDDGRTTPQNPGRIQNSGLTDTNSQFVGFVDDGDFGGENAEDKTQQIPRACRTRYCLRLLHRHHH